MEPPSKPFISVLNSTGATVCADEVAQAVQHSLRRHGLLGDACVLLTDDAEIRRLNRQFRHIDAETDVLTFPSGETDPLGDIAISIPYAQRQAAARGVTPDVEIAYLAIHGALHLAGFDDEIHEDRLIMIREMNRMAAELGLPEDHEWSSLLHGEEAA